MDKFLEWQTGIIKELNVSETGEYYVTIEKYNLDPETNTHIEEPGN